MCPLSNFKVRNAAIDLVCWCQRAEDLSDVPESRCAFRLGQNGQAHPVAEFAGGKATNRALIQYEKEQIILNCV
jgi:hypothetical protein